MANIFLAAALLSGILAVSGCAGLVPGMEALGAGGGGGNPSYGGGQAYGGGQSYPYDAGVGRGYAQPVQPYYQPQSYAYSGAPGVYVNPQAQPVPQATGGYTAAPAGRWIDRRQQRQQDRIQQGQASGQLSPREARRLQNEQGRIRGAEGRMRANGNLSPQERPRLNAMQQRSSQDISRLRHNGVQPGPAATPAHGAAATYRAVAPGGATASRSATPTQRQRTVRNDGGAP